jgi:hypothetical protein
MDSIWGLFDGYLQRVDSLPVVPIGRLHNKPCNLAGALVKLQRVRQTPVPP